MGILRTTTCAVVFDGSFHWGKEQAEKGGGGKYVMTVEVKMDLSFSEAAGSTCRQKRGR